MRDLLPNLGADGIACFLARKTGARIWIGNGSAESGGMHNPLYNSNNAICRRARAPTLASLQTPSVHLAHDLRHFGDMVFDYGISRAIGCRL